MIDDRASLNSIAQGEIDTLKLEGFDLTLEDIVMINALAWEIETPAGRQGLSRGVPFELCEGATLWPLTNYGEWAVRRSGIENLSEADQAKLMAFCMVFSRIPGALDSDPVGNAKAWASKLPVRDEEIITVVANVLQQDMSYDQPPRIDDGSNSGMTIGELVAILQATCGESAEFWETRCSASYASEVLMQAVRANKADGKPLGTEPKIMATRALGWYIEQIKARANDGEN